MLLPSALLTVLTQQGRMILQGENVLRLLVRMCMLPVPGFSDHLPSCYEKVLRDELLLQQPSL